MARSLTRGGVCTRGARGQPLAEILRSSKVSTDAWRSATRRSCVYLLHTWAAGGRPRCCARTGPGTAHHCGGMPEGQTHVHVRKSADSGGGREQGGVHGSVQPLPLTARECGERGCSTYVSHATQTTLWCVATDEPSTCCPTVQPLSKAHLAMFALEENSSPDLHSAQTLSEVAVGGSTTKLPGPG